MESIGFIGTGRIAGAVIEGLLRGAGPAPAIVVSPRNASRAAALAATYPTVSVAAENQAVIDRSRTVFLCVRPQVALEVLRPLSFSPRQTVISLIPLPAAAVRPHVAPAGVFVRALPLPTCAQGLGAVPYWPAGDAARELLSRLGRPLPLESEHELSVLWAATALIAPFYTLLDTAGGWAARNGVDPRTATDYVAEMFHALAAAAVEGPDDRFGLLAAEGATPRGLNEQALGMIRDAGAYDRVREALDAILRRITGMA
jgi:pyrroline-5-carboxylate reductase